MRFDDEEPEVDDTDWAEREDLWAAGHCRSCGIEGHDDKDCPTITPLLLRGES